MEKKRKAEDKRNRRKDKKAAEAYALANPPVEVAEGEDDEETGEATDDPTDE